MDALVHAIAHGIRCIWADHLRLHPDHDTYGFALFTTESAGYLQSTLFTRQGLEQVAAHYAQRSGNLAAERQSLRWAPADAPLHEWHGHHLMAAEDLLLERPDPEDLDGPAAAAEIALRRAAFEAALRQVDREGLFGQARGGMVLNVLLGEQSDHERLATAKRLNPADVVARFRTDLRIQEAVGMRTGLGVAVEINALACRAGVLMAAGSGGELLLYRAHPGDDTVDWVPLDAPGTRGHWAADLSPDGQALYLSSESAVLAGAVGARGLTRLNPIFDAGKRVHGLAVSPDGQTILVHGLGGLVAIDPAGRVRWRGRYDTRGLAWHPSGRRVVVADGNAYRWLDAQTGVSEAPLDLGDEVDAIAVSRDGARVAIAIGGNWGERARPVRVDLRCSETHALHVVCEMQGVPELRGLAFSPAGDRLAGACFEGKLPVWSSSGPLLQLLQGRQEALASVVWTDDCTVAAAGRNGERGPAIGIFDVGA